MSDLVSLRHPPQPLRETARMRQGLSVRVDAGLVAAFGEACKRRNLKPSELMETILWNTLGEPPMSFEPGFRGPVQSRQPTEPQKE
jgi:hypothetical protein